MNSALAKAAGGVENRFKRADERAADALAIGYVQAAGFRPAAAIAAIERLQNAVPVGQLAQFLDSHPPYPERLTILRRAVALLDVRDDAAEKVQQ
jgi:predicted Zn-dependent protease